MLVVVGALGATGMAELGVDEEIIGSVTMYKINPDGTKTVMKTVNITNSSLESHPGYMVTEYANGTVTERFLTKEELNELREDWCYSVLIEKDGDHAEVGEGACLQFTDTQPYQIYHRSCAWNYLIGERCIESTCPYVGTGAESCDGWIHLYRFSC